MYDDSCFYLTELTLNTDTQNSSYKFGFTSPFEYILDKDLSFYWVQNRHLAVPLSIPGAFRPSKYFDLTPSVNHGLRFNLHSLSTRFNGIFVDQRKLRQLFS